MCGIFGNIKNNSGKLNLPLFMSLGSFNDTRGGDSCGIFIDEYVYKGIKNEAYFSDTIYTNPIYEEIYKGLKTKVSLGHCRKTSVGKTTIEAAQPVIIYNKENPELVDMVLMHNGTLTNYKDLNSKYLVNTPDWYTDSYIMAYCIYYKGFDVFQEYKGAGAFVVVDYRNDRDNPDTYFFKGKSLIKSGYTAQEERPLYYSLIGKELWFSSIACALDSGLYPAECVAFETNKLYCFNKKGLNIIKEYDRTKISSYQYPAISSAYSKYDYYSDSYESYYSGRQYENNTNNSNNTTGFTDYSIKSYLTQHKNIDEISFIKNRYYDKNGKLLEGSVTIKDKNGEIIVIWFFKGISFGNYSLCWAFISMLNYLKIEDFDDFVLSYPELVNLYAWTKVYDGAYYTCKYDKEAKRLVLAFYDKIDVYRISQGKVIKENYLEKEQNVRLETLSIKDLNEKIMIANTDTQNSKSDIKNYILK